MNWERVKISLDTASSTLRMWWIFPRESRYWTTQEYYLTTPRNGTEIRKLVNMGQFQNPPLTGTQIIEDPGNQEHQRKLKYSRQSCIWYKYPHPSTGIPHQDIGEISISGIHGSQRLKCLCWTHPGQWKTQRIQRHISSEMISLRKMVATLYQ